ncbi:MAG: Holliday junction branch migration protein RuvA [Clostridiales bacterium]|nr:Holliday junction branch migration protein RuvA [Clostridiales bacterium]
MISYIKGILEYIAETYVIIDVSGIGYRIYISAATLERLPKLEEEVKIHTYMSVKEDGISLFGFLSLEELRIFEKLITVSGIGPKGGLGVLSVLSPADLVMAVLSDDVKALSKAPGIGLKTAQRIVLDLKDKFKNEDFLQTTKIVGQQESFALSDGKLEAVEALTALGYSRSEAVQAVSCIDCAELSTEEILRQSLKIMMK